MSMFRQVTIPQRSGQKGVRAEGTVPVTQFLGIFPNRSMTVIVMMERYRHGSHVNLSYYNAYSIGFQPVFFIFNDFLEDSQMKQWKVGIIGATGMVGQRFATLLDGHPWFQVVALAASPRSAGKTYEAAVGSRWAMTTPMPETMKDMVMLDAQADIEKIAGMVDFVFCAVDMKKDEIRDLEDRYAKAECPIVSNNSAHRFTDDVPMVIPEINADHIKIIDAQRKRLGTKRGFVAVKSNCSLQSYVPAIHPLKALGVDKVLACTYQAISGAGKTFKTWPEMVDNVIPYIGGEEEKSEQEPLKIWGKIEGDKIVKTDDISITSQCIRVPVSDGHTAAVFMSFKDGVKKPTVEEIIDIWSNYSGRAQELNLPSAPKHFLHPTVRRLNLKEILKTVWQYRLAD